MATMLDFEQHNTQPTSSTSNSMNFEELFNMELFAGSQLEGTTTSPSLSRAGSNSPSTSFFSLPPATPPTVLPQESFNAVLDTTMFDFGLPETDFSKPPPLPMNAGLPIGLGLGLESSPSSSTSPASAAPYDFFGSFPGGETPASDANTESSSLSTPKPIFAIDPSLVGVTPLLGESPPQTGAPSLPSIYEEDDCDDSEAELDTEELFPQPVKVGGKGKGRKGTVAAGGVSKRSVSASSTTSKEKAGDREKSVSEVDWRPSPEEYKKMSSKEKRQLRNKISARNFRVRRKEYISTLEGDIADRDHLIDAIRSELGSTKLENESLRQEVEALKRAMLEGRSNPDLPPPAPLPLTPVGSANANTVPKRPSTRLSKLNTQKDLPPTSPRASAARAFWGGRGNNSVFGSGVTSVHATLVPDLFARAQSDLLSSTQSQEQENINPALNLPCFGGIGIHSFASLESSLAPSKLPGVGLGSNFDAFAETNPFTFKSLDAYRMQLWGRMAREAGQKQATGGKGLSQGTHQGLASVLRPAYFNSPTRELVKENESTFTHQRYSSLTALLSGKLMPASSFSSATSIYPSPPSSPRLSPTPTTASLSSSSDSTTQTHAMLASIASQTLLSKLGSAFWDAFARPSSSSSAQATSSNSASRGDWDHDKVRRVLEGKAVVKVVDVDNEDMTESLEASMKKLSIGKSVAGSNSNLLPSAEKDKASSDSSCVGCLSRTRAAVMGKKV